MSTEKPGYFAILPANVRYDEALRPNAKLLFAEITALSNKSGYCTAGNAYFAELFGLSKKTISELISQLETQGYLRVEITRGEKKEVVQRALSIVTPIPKNRDTSPEKSETPIPKNVKENNTSINNNKDVWEEYAGEDAELLGALRDFEIMRVKRKKLMTERARKLLLTELDKLASDRETKIAILYQSIVRCWDSVYPLKTNSPAPEPQAKPTSSRRYEEW
ncbi:MAG: helix-turn-helix domain-containing protein [Butyricicoccus sp.]|nr:helix-turn-helix domain-containing protein [Butyricicoccus sp.]